MDQQMINDFMRAIVVNGCCVYEIYFQPAIWVKYGMGEVNKKWKKHFVLFVENL